jgi:ATP-dependent DNA helicase PIF1
MSRLRGESKTYYAKDGGSAMGVQRQKLLDNFMAQQVLHLTVGAQVMLIKNIDDTLVNGSMGIVVAFQHFTEYSQDRHAEFPRDRGRNENVNKPQEMRYADPPPPTLEGEPQKVGVVQALVLDEARKKPVVDFTIPGGGIRHVMLEPEVWKVELPNGEIQASRTQVRPYHKVHTDLPHVHYGTAVSTHTLLGHVHTQVTRSNA